jgi:hypothetical protein
MLVSDTPKLGEPGRQGEFPQVRKSWEQKFPALAKSPASPRPPKRADDGAAARASWQYRDEFSDLTAVVISALETSGYKVATVMRAETGRYTREQLLEPATAAG